MPRSTKPRLDQLYLIRMPIPSQDSCGRLARRRGSLRSSTNGPPQDIDRFVTAPAMAAVGKDQQETMALHRRWTGILDNSCKFRNSIGRFDVDKRNHPGHDIEDKWTWHPSSLVRTTGTAYLNAAQ